jgi:hypothetical protein
MDGFSNFGLLASQILLDEQLGKDDGSGMAVFGKDEWCPLKNYMRAIDRVGNEFGDYTLRQMGASIPKYIPLPPTITNIHQALSSVNAAYHMNHAINGVPMFSPVTGVMQDGLGNYGYEHVAGKSQIICRVDSIYPCSFDEGILHSMALRFEAKATIRHQPGSCRKKGETHCTYVINW